MRLYRLLLRLFPASFRDEYGQELTRVFARQQRDAGSSVARLGLWLRTIIDLVSTAARVHVDVLRQDLRLTGRTVRRSPGFASAVILVTALGDGSPRLDRPLQNEIVVLSVLGGVA